MRIPHGFVACSTCRGTGTVLGAYYCSTAYEPGGHLEELCPTCEGEGVLLGDPPEDDAPEITDADLAAMVAA